MRNNEKLWMALFFVSLILLVCTLFTDGIKSMTSSFTLIPHKAYAGEKANLELYAMSQCPYAVHAESALGRLLKDMGDGVNFKIDFIGKVLSENEFQSLHGKAEVDEDIRQLCIQKYSPDKLFAYLSCINADINNADANWIRCAGTNGIDILTIKRCLNGMDGKRLIINSFTASLRANARSSPTIRINNVPYSGAKDYLSLKQEICKRLKNHTFC